MKLSAKLISLMLCPTTPVLAQGNLFKIRYNAETLAAKVDSDDWGNRLTVRSESISLTMKAGQTRSIPPNIVTAVIPSPVALCSLFQRTELHYSGSGSFAVCARSEN